MSRHPRIPAVLVAAALFATACSTAAGDELTAPTIDTTTTTTVTEPADAGDSDRAVPSEATSSDDLRVEAAVAVAVEFLEESEVVATATPAEVEEIVSGYLDPSAPPEVMEHMLSSTAENQELGLTRWRHAVVDIRVEELPDGDVQVEAWQVAVITVDPAAGPSRVANIWGTDILTLTETPRGWKIIDRHVLGGPTPEPAPAVVPDDAETLEERLDGFSDAHPGKYGWG